MKNLQNFLIANNPIKYLPEMIKKINIDYLDKNNYLFYKIKLARKFKNKR